MNSHGEYSGEFVAKKYSSDSVERVVAMSRGVGQGMSELSLY